MAATASPAAARVDERRGAALLFADELRAGTVAPADLDRPDVRAAVRCRPAGALPRRVLGDLRRRRDDATRVSTEPLLAARRAVLGAAAAGPPKVLVRVDEFPHYGAVADPAHRGTAAFRRFHERMADAGVPYLVAVLPALADDPLDPRATGGRQLDGDERALLAELRADPGMDFALHGYDHRTRRAHRRRRSELAGRSAADLGSLLDRGLAGLAEVGLRPRAVVPPYNTFDAIQYPVLAQRFDVVCGGPESVLRMGLQPPGQWRGDAVYLPSYPPLYGRAGAIREAVQRLADEAWGWWAPVTLHWEWEAKDDFRGLEALLRDLAPYATRWSELLAAVDLSRRLAGDEAA